MYFPSATLLNYYIYEYLAASLSLSPHNQHVVSGHNGYYQANFKEGGIRR
jgi:hypothetical protein